MALDRRSIGAIGTIGVVSLRRVCVGVCMCRLLRAHTQQSRDDARAVRACEMALQPVEPTRARCAPAGWLYKHSKPLPLVRSGVVRCVCGTARLWCERGGVGERGDNAAAEL